MAQKVNRNPDGPSLIPVISPFLGRGAASGDPHCPVPLLESEFITMLHLTFLPGYHVSIFPSSRDNIVNLIKSLFHAMKMFLFCLAFFPDRVSLYHSPSFPGTDSVDQADLELRLPTSASSAAWD